MTQEVSVFDGDGESFDLAQRRAKMFSASDLVPKEFRGNVANCLIAMDMARRLGANPLAVMQELYIVHGKPSWSSKFIIACINQCGKFTPLRYRLSEDRTTCVAWAKELDTDEILESPPVSLEMAKAEGWSTKNGSKWRTMPELMLRYRAATFFGRLYAPDLLLGIKTHEEMDDLQTVPASNPFEAIETKEEAAPSSPDQPVREEEVVLTREQMLDDEVFNDE